MNSKITYWTLVGILSIGTFSALANGFRNPPEGAEGLGKVGGKTAQIDDASAVALNPANLTELTKLEFQSAPTTLFTSTTFHATNGQKASTRQPVKMLPSIFLAAPIENGQYAMGLGLSMPYGQSTVWSKEGIFRYSIPWYSSLVVENINPTFAFKINDEISIGVGADFFLSELEMRQFYSWANITGSSGDSDGEAKFLGQGFGGGGNIGVTWKITPHHRLALTYRSAVDVEYSGTFHMTNIPDASRLPAGLRGVTTASAYHTGIEFPAIVTLGYGMDLPQNVRVGLDVEWVQFSNYHRLRSEIDNNDVLLPSTGTLQNWHDIITCGIGADWKFSKGWVTRAGYQYLPSPIPDHSFSPTLPDGDKHVFSVGLGYEYRHHTLGISFAETYFEDRIIRDNATAAFNGTYDISSHILAFTYRYQF